MRVWITKYVLTRGIIEGDGCYALENDSSMLALTSVVDARHERILYQPYFHRNEWHTTYEAALSRALAMIESERRSLHRKMSELDKLQASLKTP